MVLPNVSAFAAAVSEHPFADFRFIPEPSPAPEPRWRTRAYS